MLTSAACKRRGKHSHEMQWYVLEKKWDWKCWCDIKDTKLNTSIPHSKKKKKNKKRTCLTKKFSVDQSSKLPSVLTPIILPITALCKPQHFIKEAHLSVQVQLLQNSSSHLHKYSTRKHKCQNKLLKAAIKNKKKNFLWRCLLIVCIIQSSNPNVMHEYFFLLRLYCQRSTGQGRYG